MPETRMAPVAWLVTYTDATGRKWLRVVFMCKADAMEDTKALPADWCGARHVEPLFTASHVRQAVAGALREAAVAAQPVRDAEPMARQVLDLVVADLRRRADEAEKGKDATYGSLD